MVYGQQNISLLFGRDIAETEQALYVAICMRGMKDEAPMVEYVFLYESWSSDIERSCVSVLVKWHSPMVREHTGYSYNTPYRECFCIASGIVQWSTENSTDIDIYSMADCPNVLRNIG